MLWTSSVIYLVTPLLWLVKTPADMNELRDLHSSALILIASKIIMAMLAIRRGFSTLVLHCYCYQYLPFKFVLSLDFKKTLELDPHNTQADTELARLEVSLSGLGRLFLRQSLTCYEPYRLTI